MALSQKKLAEKRNRRNQSRKGKKYTPRRYFDVEGKQAVETTVAGNRLSVESDTITL